MSNKEELNFEEIFHSHKNLVLNLALNYVHHLEDAQDITQDVFVQVYKSIDDFKEQSQLSTWIYRITINKSLDFLKSRKTKKRFGFLVSIFKENSLELEYDFPHYENPALTLEQKEALESLLRKIDKLPNQQKTVILLSKIEYKSQAEIADIMQISTKAVESLVQRAKVNLLKMLNQKKD